MNLPKFCRNCLFPHNFHTRKLVEVPVFYTVHIKYRIPESFTMQNMFANTNNKDTRLTSMNFLVWIKFYILCCGHCKTLESFRLHKHCVKYTKVWFSVTRTFPHKNRIDNSDFLWKNVG